MSDDNGLAQALAHGFTREDWASARRIEHMAFGRQWQSTGDQQAAVHVEVMAVCREARDAAIAALPAAQGWRPTIDEALARIPDGWTLDHLCEHWNATFRSKNGATCKLVDLAMTDAAQAKQWVEAEGETLVGAILNACAKAKPSVVSAASEESADASPSP